MNHRDRAALTGLCLLVGVCAALLGMTIATAAPDGMALGLCAACHAG